MVLNSLSIIFAIAILLVPFILKNKKSVPDLSNLSMTLGIFGTFSGIFLGLFFFNVNDISASVPTLLEGLKLAFLTSISGMVNTIILKINPQFYGIIESDNTEELATIETLVRLQKENNQDQREINKNQLSQLKNIENALTGEGETTLVTQIQKLRTTFSDKQDDLITEFRSFAETMAKNNTDALIDALTEVMSDFNAKINEQFGDNFKRLNEAVEKLLEWQENYKEQIKLMTQQFEISTKGIEQSNQSLSSITEKAQLLIKVSEDLSKILVSINHERARMQENLQAFSNIATKAENAFPIIEEQLKSLTTGLADSVKLVTEEFKVISNNQKDSIDHQIKSLSGINETLQNYIKDTTNQLNSQLEKFTKENSERIAMQVEELDKALEQELVKSLETFGRQLASLSNKFAEDYSPITTKLQSILKSLDGNQ